MDESGSSCHFCEHHDSFAIIPKRNFLALVFKAMDQVLGLRISCRLKDTQRSSRDSPCLQVKLNFSHLWQMTVVTFNSLQEKQFHISPGVLHAHLFSQLLFTEHLLEYILLTIWNMGVNEVGVLID
jgi:hypothetical protein